EGRVVVGVEQVMHHPWMIGQLLIEFFQDRRTLELIGEGLVGGRSQGRQSISVENLRFVIIGIFAVKLFQRVTVSTQACSVANLTGFLIDPLVGGNEISSAWGLPAYSFRFLARQSPA